jgi:hypothetical protein
MASKEFDFRFGSTIAERFALVASSDWFTELRRFFIGAGVTIAGPAGG